MNHFKKLPSTTLGKSGRDYFSRSKALTVVLFPYESFSAFVRMAQSLEKMVQIPFNLIIVECNAPDHVRQELEALRTQFSNITILYSKDHLTVFEALNLSLPHIRTPYALFQDNAMRIKAGDIEQLLEEARRKEADLFLPKNSMIERMIRKGPSQTELVATLGLRICFLVRRQALDVLGKLDEANNLYTAGWDLMLEAKAKSLSVEVSEEVWIGADPKEDIHHEDIPIYLQQWDLGRHANAIKHFEQKWGLETQDGLYQKWFEAKNRKKHASRPHSELTWDPARKTLLADDRWARIRGWFHVLQGHSFLKEKAKAE